MDTTTDENGVGRIIWKAEVNFGPQYLDIEMDDSEGLIGRNLRLNVIK